MRSRHRVNPLNRLVKGDLGVKKTLSQTQNKSLKLIKIVHKIHSKI